MISGIQEVLLIVVILLAILFIPRMMAPKRRVAPKTAFQMRRLVNLSVRWRLALAVTFLWLLGGTLYFRPWQAGSEQFLFFGVGPVIIGWCVAWVIAGYLSHRKN